MKTTRLTSRVATAAVLLAVLVYFGFYIYNSLTVGLHTVPAYQETVNRGIDAEGLFVREEQVLTASSGGATVKFSHAEGEKVSGGGVVATLYQSSADLTQQQAIDSIEEELEQLKYVLHSAAGTSDGDRAERELVKAIAGFHAGVCAGELSDSQTAALRLRTLLFRRDYTYADSNTGELQALIDQKTSQLDGLRSSLGTAFQVVCAPKSGVFSTVADGFASLISPDSLDHLTPSQLSALLNQEPNPPSDAIGTVITSSTWYLAATLPERQASDLRVGQSYPISLSPDYDGEISMKLLRISDSENGSAAVVFSCRTHLSEITLLRRQRISIITEAITGIRVPRSALRIVTKTQKTVDPATGKTGEEEEQVQVTGVYTVVSRRSEFCPVNILYQGDDYFLVEPANPDAAKRLKEGDELILYALGLSDGKVVR